MIYRRVLTPRSKSSFESFNAGNASFVIRDFDIFFSENLEPRSLENMSVRVFLYSLAFEC